VPLLFHQHILVTQEILMLLLQSLDLGRLKITQYIDTNQQDNAKENQ